MCFQKCDFEWNSLFLVGSHDEANAASPSFTEKIDEHTKRLKDKHAETVFQPYQYRRWAEMLVWNESSNDGNANQSKTLIKVHFFLSFQVLGSHKSEDEPPMLPIFRNKVAKNTATSTSTVVSELLNPQNIAFFPTCTVDLGRMW